MKYTIMTSGWGYRVETDNLETLLDELAEAGLDWHVHGQLICVWDNPNEDLMRERAAAVAGQYKPAPPRRGRPSMKPTMFVEVEFDDNESFLAGHLLARILEQLENPAAIETTKACIKKLEDAEKMAKLQNILDDECGKESGAKVRKQKDGRYAPAEEEPQKPPVKTPVINQTPKSKDVGGSTNRREVVVKAMITCLGELSDPQSASDLKRYSRRRNPLPFSTYLINTALREELRQENPRLQLDPQTKKYRLAGEEPEVPEPEKTDKPAMTQETVNDILDEMWEDAIVLNEAYEAEKTENRKRGQRNAVAAKKSRDGHNVVKEVIVHRTKEEWDALVREAREKRAGT